MAPAARLVKARGSVLTRFLHQNTHSLLCSRGWVRTVTIRKRLLRVDFPNANVSRHLENTSWENTPCK